MKITRRKAIKNLTLAGTGLAVLPCLNFKLESMSKRKIPSTGELIPVIGLGTWQTFDVGNDSDARVRLQSVLNEMQQLGGAMIDSSPMYGSSEKVVGDLSQKTTNPSDFFYATKVWTTGKDQGIREMNASFEKMQRTQMDLMQIHNLLDWKTHLKTLRKWKEEGKIRYWGITHYTDSSHRQLADVIKAERPDFVQFNYSIRDRHAEKFLLPTCQEYGAATIINRPYETGSLFRITKGVALPEWAAEFDIHSWGQFFLKFILSHPGITCVIPGTSKVKHVIDNMKAGYGRFPDEKGRERMADFIGKL